MYFAAHIAKEHAFAIVRSYLAAVCSSHIRTGHIDPLINTPRLDLVLRGIQRSKGIHLRPQRLPVTVRILAAIQRTLPQVVRNEHDRRLYWAICTTSFFGFFRIGELLGTAPPLTPADISLRIATCLSSCAFPRQTLSAGVVMSSLAVHFIASVQCRPWQIMLQ